MGCSFGRVARDPLCGSRGSLSLCIGNTGNKATALECIVPAYMLTARELDGLSMFEPHVQPKAANAIARPRARSDVHAGTLARPPTILPRSLPKTADCVQRGTAVSCASVVSTGSNTHRHTRSQPMSFAGTGTSTTATARRSTRSCVVAARHTRGYSRVERVRPGADSSILSLATSLRVSLEASAHAPVLPHVSRTDVRHEE